MRTAQFNVIVHYSVSDIVIDHSEHHLLLMMIIQFFSFQEMKAELSYLAHHTNTIDKYREETCCVIGLLTLPAIKSLCQLKYQRVVNV